MNKTPQLEAIFFAALEESSPPAREAYLDDACAGDPGLRRRVEKMLAAQKQASSFLEQPAVSSNRAATALPPREVAGAVIGPYKLIEPIGEGGMGTVWMARQEKPVQRKVAVKVIKPGMDTREVVARFEAERQALALMDHPNIAKVFDAGTVGGDNSQFAVPAAPGLSCSDEGRPYFVMELVKGVPVTAYCDAHRLTPRQRLELFLPICQAVQHAHQKGIIHRDLKPSNVLVAMYDGQPVPKVIDFGVAKATGQTLTEKTVVTGFGAIVGTVEYMSPEQASFNQLDVDTRSDIYSLGVLLYELMTGTTPFTRLELSRRSLLDTLRVIREEEPTRPSAKLSTAEGLPALAANRGMEPLRLTRLVRGELDWIVMKALEKDRNRRYETANALAMDVQRYLADEPVLACPPSLTYRLQKFTRKNKANLGAAAVLGLAMLVVVAAIGWVVRDRTAQYEEAQRANAARQAKVDTQGLRILDEVAWLEKEEKWPEALDAARRAAVLMASGDADAEVMNRIRRAIADLELVRLLDAIRAGRCEIATEVRFDFRASAEQYASAFRGAGIDLTNMTLEEAAQQIRSRSAVLAALCPALDDWAVCCRAAGDRSTAEGVWKLAGLVDSDVWRQKVRQALDSRDAQAMQILAQAPDLMRQPASTLMFLEVALREVGRSEAAADVLAIARRLHPADFWVHFGMAQVQEGKQPPNLEQAASCYRMALAVRPRSALAWNNLGTKLRTLKQSDEAIACYQRAIELSPTVFAPHHNLGLIWFEQGKLDNAMDCWRKALELNPKGAVIHCNLGHALMEQGKLDDALACFDKALELQPRFAVAYFNRAAALAKLNRLDEAIASYRQSIEIDPEFALTHQRLDALLLRKEKMQAVQKQVGIQREQDAIRAYREAIRLEPSLPQAYTSLARLLTTSADLQLRDPPAALELAQKAVELAPQSAEAWRTLGWAQYRAGDARASITALEKSIALQEIPKGGDARQWFFLAMAHWQLGAEEEASQWYQRAVARMDKYNPRDPEMLRVRAEAEELFEIKKR